MLGLGHQVSFCVNDKALWSPGGLSANEGDHLSLRSTPYHQDRRVSVETVATEPWLRPGTSDPLNRLGTGQNRRERPVTRDIQDGPSTYHG